MNQILEEPVCAEDEIASSAERAEPITARICSLQDFTAVLLLSPHSPDAAQIDSLATVEVMSGIPENRISGLRLDLNEDELDGLEALSGLLGQLRQFALRAVNLGAAAPAQIALEQAGTDAAIATINRLAAGGCGVLGVLMAENLGVLLTEGTVYSLAEVASGGCASLRNGPALGLRVIRQAQEEILRQRRALEKYRRTRIRTETQALEATLANIRQTRTFLLNAQMALECALRIGREAETAPERFCAAQSGLTPENILELLACHEG